MPSTLITDSFRRFMRHEAAGGILLVAAAILAMVLANTPFHFLYKYLIETPVALQIGALQIAKPLLLWVNDGLMAIFFFLVGLELKREFIEGELSKPSNIILPALGAVGGMVIPALIYWYFNAGDSEAVKGWAIPAATDIAFALGVLTLLGNKVPTSLKVFLTSLAIFDDVGAILIIAFFYTSKLSVLALGVVLGCIVFLFFLNKRGSASKSMYISAGIVMWVAMLKSGVHATLAGVILAMFIPIKTDNPDDPSPLKTMEHDLHPTVAFLILPVFAFCNSGIELTTISVDQLLHPIPLGIALGLFVGKQIGVFTFCWLGIKMGLAQLPKGVSYLSLYGVSIICGIGFTMSLFIGALAFEDTSVKMVIDERLGILIGSLLSGVAGYLILKFSLKEPADH